MFLLLKVVLVLELLNTAATVRELLLTSEKWMALTADVYSHLVLVGESCERITTCASYFTFIVIRMDSFLHVRYLLSSYLDISSTSLKGLTALIGHPAFVRQLVYYIKGIQYLQGFFLIYNAL